VRKHDNKRLEKSIQATESETNQAEEVHQTQLAESTRDRTSIKALRQMRKIWSTHRQIRNRIMPVLLQRSRNQNRIQEVQLGGKMLNDPLANVMSAILTYEGTGKRELLIHPVSKIIRRVLSIMQEHGYVGQLEEMSEGRGGFAKLHLMSNVNKC